MTDAPLLASVMDAYRLLSSFFVRYAALLRKVEELLPDGLEPVHERAHTYHYPTVSGANAGQRWLLRWASYAWHQPGITPEEAKIPRSPNKDARYWAKEMLGLILAFDRSSKPSPDLWLLSIESFQATRPKSPSAILEAIYDVDFPDELQDGRWVKGEARDKDGVAFTPFLWRLPLADVDSVAKVETEIVHRLLERYGAT